MYHERMNLILADFNKCDGHRLQLTCVGTHRDLEKFNITLTDGMELAFYDADEDADGNSDNLVVSGIVEYDKENERWTARINWDDIKNISQLSLEERRRFGIEM